MSTIPTRRFTNAQLPLLKVPALYIDELMLLDPVDAPRDTVCGVHIARDPIWLLNWRNGKKGMQENDLHYLVSW